MSTVMNGFTSVPDDLLEALASSRMPPTHLRIVLAIVRLTYGQGVSENQIGVGRICEITNGQERSAMRALADLKRWRVLDSRPYRGSASTRWVVAHQAWKIDGPAETEARRARSTRARCALADPASS